MASVKNPNAGRGTGERQVISAKRTHVKSVAGQVAPSMVASFDGVTAAVSLVSSLNLSRTLPLLTLAEALKTGRLQDFIAQEEARGVGPIDRADLDRALAKMVKAPQSKDQTSRSPLRDGSTGKRTRQGNGRHI
jgi:hypothetical protein